MCLSLRLNISNIPERTKHSVVLDIEVKIVVLTTKNYHQDVTHCHQETALWLKKKVLETARQSEKHVVIFKNVKIENQCQKQLQWSIKHVVIAGGVKNVFFSFVSYKYSISGVKFWSNK